MREFLIIGSEKEARQVGEIIDMNYKHYTWVRAESVSDIDDSINEGIIAIKDIEKRKEAASALLKKIPEFQFKYIIHPFVCIGEEVKIGSGTLILAGTIIQTGANIGEHCQIGAGAIIDTDVIIPHYENIETGHIVTLCK